tara:strand:- start:465 stop:953 length:489 start_codon:yes stop_codon:yes gene_type:complete
MKTYKQFQEQSLVMKGLKSKPVQRVIGKTPVGRFVRSFALPDTISGTKIPFTNLKAPTNTATKLLDVPYQAATDSMFMGPATPYVFGASLLTRAYGPTAAKIGKKIEKNRVSHDKIVTKGLTKSPNNKGKSPGDIEQQKNRYMYGIQGVNGPLYPGYKPIKI